MIYAGFSMLDHGDGIVAYARGCIWCSIDFTDDDDVRAFVCMICVSFCMIVRCLCLIFVVV